MVALEPSLLTKKALAEELGISRTNLYYQPVMPIKDWLLKIDIEEVLHRFPSYGHRRIAQELRLNKKRILRVMNQFGIKPRRRRRKPKFKADKSPKTVYPNLLLNKEVVPDNPNNIWATDFTYLWFKNLWVYLATVIDIYTREIVGFNLLTNHSTDLVAGALIQATMYRQAPKILHSDQGSEYTSKDYTNLAKSLGIEMSMSRPGSPWENGYQEGFCSQFKLDLGDPSRFDDLGQLAYNIYRAIYIYNHLRIHGELKKPPAVFAESLKVEPLSVCV